MRLRPVTGIDLRPQMTYYPNPWCFCSLRPHEEKDDLCHLFACAAWKTWWDLRDSEIFDVAVSEDSITDMLLLEMLRRTDRLLCRRYTRRGEAKSGADWLWWFISENRGFPVLIQSKRLYDSGRYEALRYTSGSDDQTRTLLRYAGKRKWFPMFCFYNFWASSSVPDSPCWGCSLASAHSIENVLSRLGTSGNELAHILPISVPWCHLVCPAAQDEVEFPDAIRRRIVEITRVTTAPEVQELPTYVRELLDGQSTRMDSFENHTQPLADSEYLAGIVVVSDQPIRHGPHNRDNPR